MAKALFYIVRHGRTEGNELGLYRGHSKERFAQLSQEGRQDIREAAMFLKGMGLRFPAVLADDLPRAVETAQILVALLGVPQPVFAPGLRPLDVGDYTGKLKNLYPVEDFYAKPWKPIPGGESVGAFNVRMADVFSKVLELVEKLGKPVLVVGHGSTLSFLYNKVNAGGGNVGYEGVVEPGGVLAFTGSGIVPLLKEKDKAAPESDVRTQVTSAVSSQVYSAEDPASFEIEPFREYPYEKTYFEEGMAVLEGFVAPLEIGVFELDEEAEIPSDAAAVFNNGEPTLDTRYFSYPLA